MGSDNGGKRITIKLNPEEINILLATEVMGWEYIEENGVKKVVRTRKASGVTHGVFPSFEVWEPYEDICQALQCLEKFHRSSYNIEFDCKSTGSEGDDPYMCHLYGLNCSGFGKTMPEAICEAITKAIRMRE